MSIESAKVFYSRMTTDEAFRTPFEQAATKEERKQLLQVAGYDFTPEEWQVATAEIQDSNSANSELSDAQLEAVSGGVVAQAIYGVIQPYDISEWLKQNPSTSETNAMYSDERLTHNSGTNSQLAIGDRIVSIQLAQAAVAAQALTFTIYSTTEESMSIESAKAFYSRMTTDQAFRTQLEQASTGEERQQILQAAGYDFTPEDWEAAKTQIQASNSANGELSDAELTAVSGGLSIPDIPIFPAIPAYGIPINDPIDLPLLIDPQT